MGSSNSQPSNNHTAKPSEPPSANKYKVNSDIQLSNRKSSSSNPAPPSNSKKPKENIQQQLNTLQQQRLLSLKASQLQQETKQSILLEIKLKQLQQKQTQLQQDLKYKNSQYKQLQEELNFMKNNVSKQKKQNSEQIRLNNQKKLKQTELNKLLQESQQELTQKQTEFQAIKKQVEQLALLQQKNNKTDENNKLKQQLKKQQENLIKLRKQIENLKQEKLKSKDIAQSIQQEQKKKNQLVTLLNSERIKLEQELKEEENALKNREIIGNTISPLFCGDVLENQEHIKQYLTEVLQKRVRNKIRKTKLIYRYDSLNLTNFHNYFDKVENLVVVVKLINGQLIAAWTAAPFLPNKPSQKDALLISLTNQQYFELIQPNRRGIAYDDFFLIFGNSQLRLKTLQKKVFSNFGISNGYFNPKGKKVHTLLGSGSDREVEIQTYQFFQLKFK